LRSQASYPLGRAFPEHRGKVVDLALVAFEADRADIVENQTAARNPVGVPARRLPE